MVLAFFAVSCSEGITGPGTGATPDNFKLLVEGRDAGGVRSIYTLGALSNYMAPFTGAPADASALLPSPDGKTIAYLRTIDGFARLWAMDRDGAHRRPILDGDISIESAMWSPDGTKFVVAFTTNDVSVDIATVNADGTNFVDLTPDPLPGVYFDRDPSWAPDGKRIAFSSNRSGTRHLWLMNADGSAMTQVIPASAASNERNPVWSPDGSFIAVVATTPEGAGITFIRPDGTDVRHIVIAPGPTAPVWLPDGRLVYIANSSGSHNIFSLDRASGVSTQITSRRGNDLRVSVLANVAPFSWLGFAAPLVNPLNRPTAVAIDAAHIVSDSVNDLLILSPTLHELRVMRSLAPGVFDPVGGLYAEGNVIDMMTARVSPDLLTDIVARADSDAFLWTGRIGGPGIATKIPMNGILRDQVVTAADASGRFAIVSLVERGTQPFRIVTRTVDASDSVVIASDLLTTQKNAQRMCAADVTGDGISDLAIFSGTTSLNALLAVGRGDLTFDTPRSIGMSISTDITAVPVCADLNGDGKDDLVLVSAGTLGGVAVRLVRSTTYGPATKIDVRPAMVVVADIDRDGDNDLIIGSSTSAELFVALNRGDGRFETPVSVTLASIPTVIVAADLNGDNWPDIALIDANGSLEIILSRGRIGM